MTTTKPRNPQEAGEVVLPSGLFAHIRPASFVDKLVSSAQQNNSALLEEITKTLTVDPEDIKPYMFTIILISRIVLFDEQVYSPIQVLKLDGRDSDAILQHISPYIINPK